jgi:NAD(P)H-dependent FMN reductase
MDSSRRNHPPAPAVPALQLAVIASSNREGRFGPVIADWFSERLALREDFAPRLIDLGTEHLPTALVSRPDPTLRGTLDRVSPVLAAADALVIITPEYNHSFPASLKSLIDWHYSEWRAKPVGFVSYGGISGGLRAVEQLKLVLSEMHAAPVRDSVAFPNARYQFDAEGRHKDPAACEQAATRMLDQLAWWGHALRNAKATRPYAA